MVDQQNTSGFSMANPDARTESRPCHGRKRIRDSSQSGTDEGNDEFEIPAKKRKVFEQWLKSNEDNLPQEICILGESTPKRSPIDSAYGSVGKSPYVSYPSVGTSSGIDISPRSSFKWGLKESASFAEEKKFRSHSDLENLFRRNYKLFKAELDPNHNLADKLYQMDIISRDTREQLSEERYRRRRADIFIKALVHDSRASIPDIYNKVISVFHEEKIDYLLHNEGKTTKKARALKLDKLSEGKSFLISELQFLAKGLQDHLEPWDIIDDLLVSGSLSFADHEDIYKATARHDRVRIILDHVKRAGNQHFHHFIDALNIKYPKLTKQLRDTHLLPDLAQEIRPQLQRIDTGNNKDQIMTPPISHGPTMMEFKMKFGPEPVQDVEMSVVEYNTSRLNLSLEEEAMEIAGISIEGIKFSSVKITFAAHSDDAFSKFKEAINDPPQLQRLLTQMMTQEQLQDLKDRNVQSVKVEIRIPEGSIINSKCTCKLSKEIIVQSYTYLVENIVDPSSMIDAFAKSNLLQENVKSDLLNLKENDLSSASKTNSFLMMLLTLPDECVCFFEKQLRCMNQEHIIEKLIEKKASESGSGDSVNISPKDIRRNWSYLVEEIEPKMFLSIFETTDATLEEIISADSREKRSKLFLRCMLKAGPKAIGKFHRELIRRGMNYIIDVLCIKDTQYENLCSNILKCYSKLLEEIEPTRLRDKLVQEGVFKAKEFEEIFKISLWRRDRVVWLLRKLLRKDQRAIAVFIDCLKIANYDDIVKAITDSKDELVDCPLLTSKIQEENGIKANGNDFDFSADFTIKWIEETRSESDLQLSLHKEIYKRNDEKTVDRTEFTKSWIVSQSAVTETEDQTSTIDLKKGAHEMNVCEKENYDTLHQGPKLAGVFTNDGDSCITSNKIHIECTHQCVAQATGGGSAYISRPASKPAVSSYEQSVSPAKQIEEYHDQVPSPCRKECEDTRHYILHSPSLVDRNNSNLLTKRSQQSISRSPVGSVGTSCYSNDFEDISPCPSPVLCMDGEAVIPLQPFNFNICSVDEPSAYSSNSHKLLPLPYFIDGSPNGNHPKQADRFAPVAKEKLQTFDSKPTKMNSCYNKWLSKIFKRLEKTGTTASTCQLRYKRGGCHGRKARKFTACEK